MKTPELRPETLCIQAGDTPGNGEPRQIPIIQSTTFRYETSEAMGKLFDLEADGYFYSRLQNPTCDHVAAKIAALEGGTAAMLTGSGQAANFMAMFNIACCGDHIVSSASIYGGSYNLFAVTMKRMGLSCTFVDPDCSAEELDAAFRPNTKAVFGETIANPALTVLDIEKFAAAAHAHGVPLIVDNTFATPVNCRPLSVGRGYRDALHHKVYGRPCGGPRRLHCRRRQIRLDDTSPKNSPACARRTRATTASTYTERFGLARRVHHKGHRPAHARPRRGAVPAERLLSDRSRPREPARAHAAGTAPMRSKCGRVSAETRQRSRGCSTAACPATAIMSWRRNICRTAPAASFRSASRAARAAAERFHEPPEACLHRDARRRCADMLPASRQHDAPPDERQ